MSDDKPMRQEDYRAMAEEVRLLRAECDRLQRENAELVIGPRSTGPKLWHWLVPFGFLGFVAASCLVAVAVVEVPSKPEQKYPCYFVRHLADEADDRRALPWETWYVFQAPHNHYVRTKAVRQVKEEGFCTKQEAWDFIQKWKLEACK